MTKAFDILCCPKCHEKLNIDTSNNTLSCQKESHRFQIENGIPIFVKREEIAPEDGKWVFEYDETAEKYDEAILEYSTWLGVDIQKEITQLIEKFPIQASQQILDVSTGTGNIVFGIKEVYSNLPLKLTAIDLSKGFLQVAQRKFTSAGIDCLLIHSQVNKLPFQDETFDVITHSGGINTYSDIPGTLEEWTRVLKPDGTLIFVDEGVSPSVRKTQRGKDIIKANSLFAAHPPLEHLPANVKNIELQWIIRGTFYVIKCEKGEY
ncbi:MAG: methyltransferase domain-containing protein [Candidatus Hodarchaeota archaeon]